MDRGLYGWLAGRTDRDASQFPFISRKGEISPLRRDARRLPGMIAAPRMTARCVAPAATGTVDQLRVCPVPFDNALNVHFPRARPCARIRNPPPAAPVARWPMTDAHGVKANVSPTGDTLLRGKWQSLPNFRTRSIRPRPFQTFAGPSPRPTIFGISEIPRGWRA